MALRIDPNETVIIPDPDPVNNSLAQDFEYLNTPGWNIGVMIFFGGILLVVFVVVIKNRKKTADFNERIDKFGQNKKEKPKK